MAAPVVSASTLWNGAFATTATSSAITTPAACHLEVFIAESSAIDTGVTDSFGNTYVAKTLTPAANSSFGQVVGVVYVCENGVGGSGHTFTVTWASSSIIATMAAIAITGAPTSGGMDLLVGAGTNSGASTSVPVAQGTTASAVELVLSFALGGGNAETITGTYTSVQNFVGAGFYPPFALTSLATTTTGTYGDTFTGSVADEYAAGTVSIKAASGGGGVTETLAGQSVGSTEGTVTRVLSYLAAGQTITSTLGTITRAVSYALTGHSITSTEGTITAATGGNVTLTLSGQALTSTLGASSAVLSYAVTGLSLTSIEGAIAAAVGASLLGQSLTSTEGAIAETVTYSVSGQSVTSTEGTIVATTGGNVTLSLAGQALTSAVGNLAPQAVYTASGLSITSAEGSLAGAVSTSLAGQILGSSEGIIVPSVIGNVTVQLTGLAAVISLGTISVSGVGAGKHRKRYGVLDGDRLLIFDTRVQADTAKAVIAARNVPQPRNTRKLKVRPLPAAREVVPLPQIAALAARAREEPQFNQLVADRASTRLADLYHILKERQEDEDAAITLLHLDRLERDAHRTHAMNIITALQHYLRRLS